MTPPRRAAIARPLGILVLAAIVPAVARVAPDPATTELPPRRPDVLDKQRPGWTPDGTRLLFARHESDGEHIVLYWLDPDRPDDLKRLTDRKEPEYNAAISPDGARVLFVAISFSGTQGNLDILSIAADGSDMKTVVGDGPKLSHEDWPTWAPDGKRFAFSSTRDGNQEIYAANADGSDITRLTQSPGQDLHPCWSPSGDFVVFVTDRWSGLELARVAPDGTGLQRLTTSPGFDDYPAVAPNGRDVAFVSNRDGNYEIYLLRDGAPDPINLSNHPGRDDFPCWTPDGRAVTFLSDRDGGFDFVTVPIPLPDAAPASPPRD